MDRIILDDATFADAARRGREERAQQPVPVRVSFDAASGRIILEFSNGAAFLVPARSLQGLEDASDDELSEVELLGETGLHWERRDVDFRIAGLMAGVFGTAAHMRLLQAGRHSTSPEGGSLARGLGVKPVPSRKTS